MSVPDYLELDDFKSEIGIDVSDTADDVKLMRTLSAASRTIDRLCRRMPGDFSPQTATRTFDIWGEWTGRNMSPEAVLSFETWYLGAKMAVDTQLFIPPLLSVTSLATDWDSDGTFETTWATTDYILYPLNSIPKRHVQVNLISGRYRFPVGQSVVQIVGSWGEYTTVPDDIAYATFLLANRLRNRAKSPEGMMGDTERGFTSLNQIDPDVRAILVGGGYVDYKVFA